MVRIGGLESGYRFGNRKTVEGHFERHLDWRVQLRIVERNQVAATEQVVEWAAVDLVVTFVAVGTLNLLDQLVDEKLVEE